VVGTVGPKAGHSRNVSGVDEVSINRFAQYADEHIHDLSGRLQIRTPYAFSSLKAHLEPKPDSKSDRIICIPTVRDRIVQRALLDYLVNHPRYAFATAVSYGYIKTRRVSDAVKRAAETRKGLPWAYKTDIATFFDSVDRDILRKLIKSKIAVRSLHPLLLAAIDCEIQPNSESQRRRIKAGGIRNGRGLRQGMPLSPYFSNVMPFDFDRAVIKEAYEMVRYADDLVFFASSQKDCEAIHEFCVRELRKINLAVHPLGTPKSHIAPPGAPVGFLGVQIAPTSSGYQVEIANAQIEKKKAELSSMSNIKGLLEQRITLTKFLNRIDAKITGWNDAYSHCANIQALTDMLNDCRQRVITDVLVTGLGITNPNSEIRQFLELDPFPSRRTASN
jgi:RNA-directed DNA polymerase